MIKTITHPAIFQRGMDAFEAGRAKKDNPYLDPYNHDKATSWRHGWERAEKFAQHDLEEYRKDQET
jgi:hypothetical protein